MNILFLCTANLNRSKTAENHFAAKDPLHTYRSAGLSEKECKRNNTTLCSEELLTWADLVFVMEDEHVRRIEQHTDQRFLHKVINLHIPDVYQYGEPDLIEQLEKRRDTTQFEEAKVYQRGAVMKVEIERTEDGEPFFRLPDEYLVDLKWEDGDVVYWIDNKDGSWTLRKSSVASPSD
ncbi:hypothetical protein [Shewanella mangrovisoli]|uniref:hypothetical protein n=1 Tax=Shewanella mangrovisoli TaxID=2864211 RepID=UPI0035B8ED92